MNRELAAKALRMLADALLAPDPTPENLYTSERLQDKLRGTPDDTSAICDEVWRMHLARTCQCDCQACHDGDHGCCADCVSQTKKAPTREGEGEE